MTGAMGAVLWLIVAIGFFVFETVTIQLVSIWFGVGALAAIIPAFLGFSLSAQIIIFLIVSVVVLLTMRPIAKKRLVKENQPTNADMVIGMIGFVTEPVDNIAQTGRVTANGLSWSAKTVMDGTLIQVGEKVKVLQIEGVKLIVEHTSESRSEDVTWS